MSYVLNPPGGDNVQGDVDPNQVAYGDPDDPGKIKGSDNFTFVDETPGTGADVKISGDRPTFTLEDDTAATNYQSVLSQSGASGYWSHVDSTGVNKQMIRVAANDIIINELATDVDVRIEGQGEQNLLRTFSAHNNVGIGTAPDSGVERLHIKGTGDTQPMVRLEATGSAGGATDRPVIDLYTPNADAAGDNLGKLSFTGKDATGNDEEYAAIEVDIQDATAGSEDGRMKFLGRRNAAEFEYMRYEAGNVTVNELGANISFRIEGDNEDSLFRTDASNDNIGIGGVPSANVERLDIQGTQTGTRTVRITTNAPVAEKGVNGPYFDLKRSNSDDVGQVNSNLGIMRWIGEDSASNDTVYAYIAAEIYDPTNGSEDGVLKFNIMDGGTGTEYVRLTARDAASPDFKGVIINETSADVSFRVESDGVNPAFMVDSGQDNVGIGTAPTSGLAGKTPRLHVKADPDNSGILIEDDAADADAGPEMVLYRSSSLPTVNDLIGRIRFEGQDSGGNPHTYFRMSSQIKDPTDASEDGNFFFTSRESGALFDVMKINGASLEINPNTNSNINLNVRTNLTTQAQSFFRTYNNTNIAERYTEVLRGSRTLTSTPVTITADRCYGSNIVTSTGASVVNLPEAVPGMHLQVVNKNISGISIAPASGDTINGSTSSFSVQHGWVIAKVICIADGEWVVGEAN